jgi:circadian clock protein KaiC
MDALQHESFAAPLNTDAACRTNGMGWIKLSTGRKLKVLLAEDNPINRKVTTLQLKGVGLEVDTATNGQGLDTVTEGGLPRGRPTLICGGPGTGKTLMAMEFLVRGATEYGEPGVFVSFEERPEDLVANVASLGFHLSELEGQKKLAVDYVHLERNEIEETGRYNLEGLFIRLGSAIDSVKAKRIAFDTLENLYAGFQNHSIVRAELGRLFGWLKDRGITAVITAERGEGALTRYALEEYIADCVILLDHRVADEI